jgi:hypothetical protein
MIVSVLAAAGLAWAAGTGLSQEQVPPPKEKPQEKVQEKVPEKLPPLVEEPAHSDCHHERPSVKILWMEREVPVQVLTPREVIIPEKYPTLEVAYREVKRKVIEIVMKPREVTREVPCTTLQPCTVCDPHTGCCTTVMQPVTVMKLRKETVFYPAPEEREIVVKVPYVKEAEEIVPRRTVILEYRTEMQKRPSAVAIPGPVFGDRMLLAPKGCEHPEHP